MENEEKESETTIDQNEISENEKNIYPENYYSSMYDKLIDKSYNIKSWADMFYSSKTKLVKERFLNIISNSEFAKFFEALDYEYGINDKSQDIQKAFQIYKAQADNTTDALSMYKMYHIYRKEFTKFNIPQRNRILERFYLFKCFSYLSNHEYERYSYLFNRFYVTSEVQKLFNYEDKDFQKFNKLITYLNKYYEYYKINKDDLMLIKAIILLTSNDNNDKTQALDALKYLIDNNNLEAKYKMGLYHLKEKKYAESEKIFEELVEANYYRCFCDYSIYLFKEKKDSQKALEYLEKASKNGILRANYLYYDIYLSQVNFDKIEVNKEFMDNLLIVFDKLINDIATDGLYSYFEFIYLRKICIKHWNLKDFIKNNFDVYTKEFVNILENNSCSIDEEQEIKNKKEKIRSIYIRDDYFLEFNLACAVYYYYGIEDIVDIDLKKSLLKLNIYFKNAEPISFQRFCLSYLSRIKQKLFEIDDKLITNEENEQTKKQLFELYYNSIEKERIKYLSSSFFYFLASLYKKKWGNPGDELMLNICLKRASEYMTFNPGTGTIISYYRRYKAIKYVEKNWDKYICKIIIKQDSEGYGEDNSLCPICFERKRNIIFLPCKHLFCDLCTKKILEKGDCPICRRAIISYYDYMQIQDNKNKDD